jgi:hypothetical protein
MLLAAGLLAALVAAIAVSAIAVRTLQGSTEYCPTIDLPVRRLTWPCARSALFAVYAPQTPPHGPRPYLLLHCYNLDRRATSRFCLDFGRRLLFSTA